MQTGGIYQGRTLQDTVQVTCDNPKFFLPGRDGTGQHANIPVDAGLLSKHLLLLGGVGSGKTNVFNHIVRNIRSTMHNQDVMLVFDAKGDYVKEFYRPGDIIISNDSSSTDYWNIFDEITIDDRVEENISEIADFLFKDKIAKSSSPFFPSAARDLFAALMLHICRTGRKELMNNQILRSAIDSFSPQKFRQVLAQYPDLQGISSYIANDKSEQTQGVSAELQQAIREVLSGNFRKKGNFSIRRQIRQKEGKVIFIEYDLGIGKMLAPIYALIIDFAIKESLCRKQDEGNVYFILDEFRLMPPLDHMDNGINFGRSLGAKFVLGLQNVDQMYDVYGEEAARSILSGCSTMISFLLLDEPSRTFVEQRAGRNLRMIQYMSTVQSKGINENVTAGNAIEDWDISGLQPGEAIVQSLNFIPFRFRFNLFQ